MNDDPLARLRIASTRKRRSHGTLWAIIAVVLLGTAGAIYLAVPRAGDSSRGGMKSGRETTVAKADAELAERAKRLANERSGPGGVAGGRTAESSSTGPPGGAPDAAELKVTGYIIARERIELSPRFLGMVKWIGVKKGDPVTNGQVVVRLDDAEYLARLTEVDAQRTVAEVNVRRAKTDLQRAESLVASRVEMQKVLDDARLSVATAEAQLQQTVAGRRLLETYLDWCVIRSPVNGVVLEKLVDPNELVSPQTFGSGRGPSTSLIAVADLTDLQVETDVSESDLAKVQLGQACIVSPEAYPDKKYVGVVAEIAPEANRAKGTLSVKVKVEKPDRFLTPELSALVRFLRVAP